MTRAPTPALLLLFFLFSFFLNYVQQSTNNRDTFFPYFKRQRIKKIYIMHQFHGQHLKIGEQNKKKTMICTLEPKLKCSLFKIMSNTLPISVTHFFRSLNVKESQEKYIMHQYHGQPPQNRRTK